MTKSEQLYAAYLAERPRYSNDAACIKAVAIRFGLKPDGVRRRINEQKQKSSAKKPAVAIQDAIPDGHRLKGVSTFVDEDGNVLRQWIKTDRAQQQWREIITAVLDYIPSIIKPLPPVRRTVFHANDLLALYPLADLHIGLYASIQDGERDWNLRDSVELIKRCIDDLISRTPAAAHAVVANLGDLTHTDNGTNMTPRSGNHLDADGRYIEIVQAALEIAVYVINRVAEHHQKVTVVWLAGNHDGATSVVLQAALSTLYRDDDRVNVVTSGKYSYITQHGQVALGFTHGDTIKSDALPLLMANDEPLIWAATQYRVWHCGHRHSRTVREYPGCFVEVHQSPAPRDAWHEQSGYRSLHSVCSIIYDLIGEYARNTIQIRHEPNLQVLEKAA